MEQLYEAFKSGDSDRMDFRVERARIEPERSFSAEAMAEVTQGVTLFIGARIMAAWEKRQEPPSVVTIRVEVEAA